MGSVSADYYEYADPWYGTEFYDINSDYYSTAGPNQIIIEFDKDGSYYISTPDNYYYNNLLNEINVCIYDQTADSNANASTLKNDVTKICQEGGIDNPNIEIKSSYGEDTFCFIGIADGISMEPTIKNGDMLVLNKTHDIKVGDIVSAYYRPQQIDILKRVAEIDGDKVYLISDNVNGTFEKKTARYMNMRVSAHGLIFQISMECSLILIAKITTIIMIIMKRLYWFNYSNLSF